MSISSSVNLFFHNDLYIEFLKQFGVFLYMLIINVNILAILFMLMGEHLFGGFFIFFTA